MLLVFQRGHVPRTSGATGTEGEQEMAIAVGRHMTAMTPPGWNLRLINADVPDSDYKGDAFVACHGDGVANKSARGASAGYQTPEGHALATNWQAAYKKVGYPGGWRGFNITTDEAKYYGVRHAVAVGNKRSCIIEVGFLTNPSDRYWLDHNLDAVARSIWLAVAGEVADYPRLEECVTKTRMRTRPHSWSPVVHTLGVGDHAMAYRKVKTLTGYWKLVVNDGITGWVPASTTK